ncbi:MULTISPECIES: hypothetical protein, partial [unclassified Microcoleus]
NLHIFVGWASRPSFLDGRDAHPTIIKIVSYLILIPWLAWTDLPRFSGSPFGSKKLKFRYPKYLGIEMVKNGAMRSK